jgi:hypothetical protein
MAIAKEMETLFRRDLTRLVQELEATPAEALWKTLPGASNSIGNLALHLEGNLREFIGRQLGSVAYQRKRPAEFDSRDLPGEELIRRLSEVRDLIPGILAGLQASQWEATFPENVYGRPLSTQQFVIALYGHLNYHKGQIDYLRRILTAGKAIEFAAFDNA